MDTFRNLIDAVYSDLTATEESGLYNLTAVKLALNRANQKATSLFKWPKTQDAKESTTQANINYYDMPEYWKPDSAFKLTINGLDYGKPILFEDFLHDIENSLIPSGGKRWAQQWNRFFVHPTPTVADLVISIWGITSVPWLVEDSETTIFSYNMRDCNDAVVQEAVAILKAKAEDENTSLFRSATAKAILSTAWIKIMQGQQHKRKTQPMFNVPDFFSGNTHYIVDTEE